MTNLTETQTIILTAGAQRPGNIAMPLPKGLHGAAAKIAIGKMIERGLLEEVDTNIREGEPLWRENGDGCGTTLKVTGAGLLAIGIEPVVGQTVAAIRKREAGAPEAKPPTPRTFTKQAMLIAMLQAPEGATMETIIAATGWQAQSARGFMSGGLGKKLGLTVTSEKKAGRGRVYRLNRAEI